MRFNSMTIMAPSKTPHAGGQTARLSVLVAKWLEKVFASCQKHAKPEPFTSRMNLVLTHLGLQGSLSTKYSELEGVAHIRLLYFLQLFTWGETDASSI